MWHQVLDVTPKHNQQKKETNKLDFIKMKNDHSSENAIKNSEKSQQNGEINICKSYVICV